MERYRVLQIKAGEGLYGIFHKLSLTVGQLGNRDCTGLHNECMVEPEFEPVTPKLQNKIVSRWREKAFQNEE